MPVQSLLSTLRANWWRATPSQILEIWAATSFDKRHGTDTSGFAELGELDIASSNKRHGQRYQPSPVFSLRRLLRRLGIQHAGTSFVDYGSGKGRTLLIAGDFPFRRVLGVEFSEALHRQAEQNIARYAPARAAEVRSVHADATQFELPDGDLVLYFFNPFTKPVLDMVLANIVASAAALPRRIVLIYLYLPDEAWLASLPGFRLRERWRKYHVFDCDPHRSLS